MRAQKPSTRSAWLKIEIRAYRKITKGREVAHKGVKAKVDPNAGEGIILDQLVTPEARKHGDYRVELAQVPDQARGEKGVEASVVRNRGGTTLDRWVSSGALDIRQQAAVLIYVKAHNLAFGWKNIGMDWSRFLTAGVVGSRMNDMLAADAVEALSDLRRVDELLKPWPPYVNETWINVVLHDQPAGVAGNLLGHETEKAARASALTIIRLCCDMIASEWKL